MESDLKEKTIKGVGWGFIDNMMNTGIMAIVNIILARLLTDTDFGLIGLTAIFITLATSMVDSGFSSALIRKQQVTEKDFNTVFYFNLLVSFLLYGLLYGSAPFLADFFGQEIMVPIVRILSFSLIISALSIVQKTILIRKIDFRTQAVISGISSVTSGLAGIVLALLGYGVWSLVVMQLLRLAVTTLLLWILARWIPSFIFSYASMKEMFSFGGKVLLTAIISILSTEVYSLIIGKVYSPGLLGQYSRADKFKSMVTSNVSIVMQRVSYPVLASIRKEQERQVRAYRKVLKTTVLISFTCILGMAAVSEALTLVLIGEQWRPAIHILRILSLSGLFLPLIVCSTNIINANGYSGITLRLEIIKTLLTVIPILSGIFFSIDALLWGMAAVSFLTFLLYARHVAKIINYSIVSQIKDILPIFLISLIMAGIVFLFSFLPLSQLPILLIQLSVGMLVILLIYEHIYHCEEYDDIRRELLRIFRKRP